MDESSRDGRFHDAMVALAFWRSRNPDAEMKDEPEDIAGKRALVMSCLSALCEGDVDPWMGRTIKILIRKSTRYVVYLDEDLEIQWWWTQRLNSEDGLSMVQANVTRLSGASAFLLSSANDLGDGVIRRCVLRIYCTIFRVDFAQMCQERANRERARSVEAAAQIRSMIGESMAMVLNGVGRAECDRVQALAEQQIVVEKDRRCRGPFFWHFLSTVICFAAAAGALTYFLEGTLPVLAQVLAAGAFGAFVSAITRTQQLALAPESGRTGLHVDALVRACIGAGAAVLVYFAFESKIVLKGALPDGQENLHAAALFFLCIAAGASERILPNLIGRAESMIGGNPATRDSK